MSVENVRSDSSFQEKERVQKDATEGKSGDAQGLSVGSPASAGPFTKEEIAIGQLLQTLPTDSVGIILAGGRLRQVRDSLKARGAPLGIGDFIQEHLAALDAKTVGMWEASFEAFKDHLPSHERIEAECSYLKKIAVSALYALSKPTATAENRQSAIALAKSGTAVKESLASSLVRSSGQSASKVTRRRLNHKVVTLPSGTVHIAITHTDFRGSLEEALTLVDE